MKRLGLLLIVLSLSIFVAAPAFAQDGGKDGAADRTFDNARTPSQTQYDRPAPPPGRTILPPEAQKALCGAIVRNRAVPMFVKRQIVRMFGLPCKPVKSNPPRGR